MTNTPTSNANISGHNPEFSPQQVSIQHPRCWGMVSVGSLNPHRAEQQGQHGSALCCSWVQDTSHRACPGRQHKFLHQPCRLGTDSAAGYRSGLPELTPAIHLPGRQYIMCSRCTLSPSPQTPHIGRGLNSINCLPKGSHPAALPARELGREQSED